jgi:uncharacterized protein (UPF0276 family)
VKVLTTEPGATRIGLAYGTGVPRFIASNPGLIDYVEVPFEQLRHTPELAALQDTIPLVLHCASLSIAGFVPVADGVVEAIGREAERTQTPWIGEHLAFTSADGLTEGAAGAPTELTYTVCPQLSEETLARVVENVAALRPRMPVPLILENSPQYFQVPGSTMSMTELIRRIAEACDVGLLLDLSHFLITSLNTGVDAREELERLPLERVVELHISGMSRQSGVMWDDHAEPAPAMVFELLEQALRRVRPRAVTLEYNWSPTFPHTIMQAQIGRARRLLEPA